MAVLTFKNVEKIYPLTKENKKLMKTSNSKDDRFDIVNNGIRIVKNFNFEIKDNEFIVLVGPSGCGKSTLLRMIAGLEEISNGEISIDGKVINNVEPKDRDIAMVFQNYALYPHMTVYDNMAFSLKLKKIDKNEIDRRVKEAAEILDITKYLERKPKALSGGQRQRVAIGRAIVRHPKVFLMDEPLSNLDAKLRNQMRAEIIKLRQKVKTNFIYVTHDQVEAMTLGDRIVVLKDGVAKQIASPNEVFNHPANLFVAGFIGTPQMNFLNGKFVKENDKYFVMIDDYKFELPKEKQDILKNMQVIPDEIIVGIRPQHLTLAKGDENAIKANLDVYELMGSEIYLHLKVNDKDVVMVVPTTHVKYEEIQHSKKDIEFVFDIKLMHFFDKQTEENLF